MSMYIKNQKDTKMKYRGCLNEELLMDAALLKLLS